MFEDIQTADNGRGAYPPPYLLPEWVVRNEEYSEGVTNLFKWVSYYATILPVIVSYGIQQTLADACDNIGNTKKLFEMHAADANPVAAIVSEMTIRWATDILNRTFDGDFSYLLGLERNQQIRCAEYVRESDPSDRIVILELMQEEDEGMMQSIVGFHTVRNATRVISSQTDLTIDEEYTCEREVIMRTPLSDEETISDTAGYEEVEKSLEPILRWHRSVIEALADWPHGGKTERKQVITVIVNEIRQYVLSNGCISPSIIADIIHSITRNQFRHNRIGFSTSIDVDAYHQTQRIKLVAGSRGIRLNHEKKGIFMMAVSVPNERRDTYERMFFQVGGYRVMGIIGIDEGTNNILTRSCTFQSSDISTFRETNSGLEEFMRDAGLLDGMSNNDINMLFFDMWHACFKSSEIIRIFGNLTRALIS